MFPTKAIKAWREASEPSRLWICGSYFHYCKTNFSKPEGFDISPNLMANYPPKARATDPLYAVTARKQGSLAEEAPGRLSAMMEQMRNKPEL